MKFNDIHKQFAVKSFAKMMTRSETQSRSTEEKDQKAARKKKRYSRHIPYPDWIL